jgi:L-threonylcarbamoyladenylate synthase
MQNNWKKAEEILNKDGVVVLPTDTLYGIVGKALSKKTVERIYEIKGRDKSKPFIVLITSYKDLEIFGVKVGEEQAKILPKFWPGKVTVILPCALKKFEYLHRGEKSIAFRMIGKKNKNLFNLIKKVGPVVAPSANPQDLDHANNIREAKKYFGSKIDLYINGGLRKGKSSTLVKFENNKLIVLRQGQVKIK